MHIPLNSIIVTFGFTVLLSLINLGSTIAFNAIISLQLLALMATYTVSIGCLALKRIKGEPLPVGRWSLGRFGLPINIFATTYASFTMIFICFPVTTPVVADSMNWVRHCGDVTGAAVANGRTGYRHVLRRSGHCIGVLLRARSPCVRGTCCLR